LNTGRIVANPTMHAESRSAGFRVAYSKLPKSMIMKGSFDWSLGAGGSDTENPETDRPPASEDSGAITEHNHMFPRKIRKDVLQTWRETSKNDRVIT
jgi:hypothetical protein